jgi:hypothetical protein
MSPKDSAAILAGLVLDTLAESIRDNPELRYRLCNLLRGEHNDRRQELIAEIRLAEADTDLSPLTSIPRKGGGHEHEDR